MGNDKNHLWLFCIFFASCQNSQGNIELYFFGEIPKLWFWSKLRMDSRPISIFFRVKHLWFESHFEIESALFTLSKVGENFSCSLKIVGETFFWFQIKIILTLSFNGRVLECRYSQKQKSYRNFPPVSILAWKGQGGKFLKINIFCQKWLILNVILILSC